MRYSHKSDPSPGRGVDGDAADSAALTTVLPENSPAEQARSSAKKAKGKNRSEPSATTKEEILFRLRRHGRHLFWPVVVLFAVAAAGGYWIGALPELWQNLLAGAGALLIALLLGIGPILSWLTRRTVITDSRIISHRGVFVRTRSEVSLGRIREVQSRQNPVQRMWRSGDLLLLVGAETRKIVDAPDINIVRSAVQVLTEQNFAAVSFSGRAHLGTTYPGSSPSGSAQPESFFL